MASSTHTLTGMASSIIRLGRSTIPAWPSPELSIDSTDQGALIQDKRYWLAQGPALQAYETVKDSIVQCLTERANDLYQGSKESCIPYSVECFMVGKSKVKACPFIVIACDREAFSRHIMTIIKAADWWTCFTEQYKGFGRFALLQCPPRHMYAGHKQDGPWVYTSDELEGHITSCYSIPIFFSADKLGKGSPCLNQQATVGGVLYIEHEIFALTVAHPFAKQNLGCKLDSSLEPADNVFYIDDIESDNDCDDNVESVTSMLDQSSIQDHNSRRLFGCASLLGKVAFCNDDDLSDTVDWALIKLSEAWAERLQDTSEASSPVLRKFGSPESPPRKFAGPVPRRGGEFGTRSTQPRSEASTARAISKVDLLDSSTSMSAMLDGFRSPAYQIERAGNNKPLNSVLQPLLSALSTSQNTWDGPTAEKNIFVRNNDGSLNRGLFYESRSIVRLAGKHDVCTLSTVRFDQEIVPGDCGQWVFDMEEGFYGHIVAGNPSLKIAYVSSAVELACDIAIEVGRLPRLSEHRGINHDIVKIVTEIFPRHRHLARLFLTKYIEFFNVPSTSLLYIALTNNHVEVARQLLDLAADSNNIGKSLGEALHTAIFRGDQEVVRLLLCHGIGPSTGDQVFRTILGTAIRRGNEGIVKLLLDHGVDPSSDEIQQISPLHEAVVGNHTEIVKLLLEHGAKPNTRLDTWTDTALHEALIRNHTQSIKLLLDHGADPNREDRRGWTPLQHAIQSNDKETARLLLDRGADPNREDRRGRTLLQRAIQSNDKETARLLLDRGADPNREDRLGWTLLQRAIQSDDEETARLLLDHGADPMVKHQVHGTAREYAISRRASRKIRRLLNGKVDADAEKVMKQSPPGGDHDRHGLLERTHPQSSDAGVSVALKGGKNRASPRAPLGQHSAADVD